MADLIHIGDMLSWQAFERWAEKRGYEEWLRRWIEPQWLAWLIVILEEAPDEPELFQHGKWATIQVLKAKLIKAAQQELNQSTT
jgi:hypothetical protein